MNRFAHLVWNGSEFKIPESIGKPREDQLNSTWIDNLSELSGRICYDSLKSKNGRNSKDYHDHIIEVNHGSVYEHPNLTYLIPDLNIPDYLSCCESLLNRPGIWSTKEIKQNNLAMNPGVKFDLRITGNMRSIREWFKYPIQNKWGTLLGETLQNLTKEKAPLIFSDKPYHDIGPHKCSLVEPKYDEEVWVSLFFTNVSRGFSHELVRHKYQTAVSQRSTRYVDENQSSWSYHPLLTEMIKEGELKGKVDLLELASKDLYKELVTFLQQKLIDKGTDKFTARKQARGAARGVLGNALMTELIFSANIAQWKWMLYMRASRHADAEIRIVFNEVFKILNNQFPDRFKGWAKQECPDGIGYEILPPT